MKNKQRPNIIFITTDTQGRDMVSAYGRRGGVDTPNLDRLASGGVLFENAFCASPVCTPARGAWYSGRHPGRHGAWTNNTAPGRGSPLLAEILGQAGYRTVHLGKWHLAEGAYHGPTEPDGGFGPPWYDAANFFEEFPEEGPNRFGAWNRGLEDINYCFGHHVASRAIEVMRDPGDKPLFLCIEFDEPHGPYICPPPFRGRFRHDELFRPATLNAAMTGKPELQKNYADFLRTRRDNPEDLPAYYRLYHDCNSYVDHEIGRVLDGIQQYLTGDTLVVFTSDHGDHHGAFGLCAKGPTLYDSTCAVPLILQGPGLPRGVRRSALASGVDIFPTLLDFAGLSIEDYTPPRGYSGVSLLPAARGETGALRTEVIMEYHRFGIGMNQDDGFSPIRGIRTADWKLVVNLFDRDELYHLTDDPDEAINRIDDAECADIRDQLHDRLLDWQDRVRDPFRSPQWMLRPWRTDRTHHFEGLFTTGYKDTWIGHDFHAPESSRTGVTKSQKPKGTKP